jgi:hypothetical protein
MAPGRRRGTHPFRRCLGSRRRRRDGQGHRLFRSLPGAGCNLGHPRRTGGLCGRPLQGRRSRSTWGDSRRRLVLTPYQRDRRSYRNPGADLGDRALEDSFLEILDLDRPFLGLDHGDDVAPSQHRPRFDEPFDERPGLHVRAKRRHTEFSHVHTFPNIAITAETILSVCGIAASSRCFA